MSDPLNVPAEWLSPSNHVHLLTCLQLIYVNNTPAQIRLDQFRFKFPTSYISADEAEALLKDLSPEEMEGLCYGEEGEMEEIVKKYGLEKVHQALNDFFEGGDDFLDKSVNEFANKLLNG